MVNPTAAQFAAHWQCVLYETICRTVADVDLKIVSTEIQNEHSLRSHNNVIHPCPTYTALSIMIFWLIFNYLKTV